MKALLQRVTSAAVSVDGVELSRIERGFLILLGVKRGDDEEDARVLAEKIAKEAITVDLATNPVFTEKYTTTMFLEEI